MIIFRETTTIGIRRIEMERTVLPRQNIEMETAIGFAQVKKCMLPDGTVRCYPEYDSVKILAEKNELSFQEAFRIVQETKESSHM